MIEKIFNKDNADYVYVNWDKSKVVKNSLGAGKKYAVYNDPECNDFWWWMSRKEIKSLPTGHIGDE